MRFLPTVGERVEERRLTRADLDAAEEMFLCSTLRDMSPVTHLNGQALGGAPSTERLLQQFSAHLRRRIAEQDAPRWRQLIG